VARVVAAAVALAAGCARPTPPAPRDPTQVTSDGSPPSFPGDFKAPAALGTPATPDPNAFGLAYLEQVYPRIRDGWSAFLEDLRLRLPPDHPLNGATLEATLVIVADPHGELVDVQVQRPSGNADFDQAARDVVRDAAPLPTPPRPLLSDDDRLYLTWQFARDQRQAGLATAKVTRMEWSLDRAVPKLLEAGELAEAARRVAAAAPGEGGVSADAMAYADRVFASAIREGLKSPDVATQRLAIAAAGEGKVTAAADDLRAIADGGVDMAARADAVAALGAVGDKGAASMLLAILERDGGANAELTGAAAHALAALGQNKETDAILGKWLADGRAGQRPRTWAALVALAQFPMPSALPDLDLQIKSGDARAKVAACVALGTTAAASADAWKALRKGLDDADATVRAACARAAAAAAAHGAKSRAAFWRAAELLKDRDERVRAAAVLAAARLDPKRGEMELQVLGREKSPPVLAALAEAWQVMTGPPSKQLFELAGHPDPAVRAAAIASLARRTDAPSRTAAVAGAVDPEPRVRLAAIPAIRDAGQLATLAGDDVPEVRAAAQIAIARQKGRKAIRVEQLQALAAAPPASAERIVLARAWFAAK